MLSHLAYAQATLPLSRTTWSATPVGWTDNFQGATYTSTLTCDGNSNRARLDATGDATMVFFTGTPNVLSFDLQGNGISASNSLLVEESPDGVSWTTISNISSISGSCVTYTYALQCPTAYVRWTYNKPAAGNLALDNVSINSTTCGGGTCPSLTGAILNSCDNGTAGCNEGDAEVMFMNTGSYSITVSSLPSNVVNYYGSTTSYTTPTIDASTGTFTTNAAATAALNSQTGCSGVFIDGAAAGTIPAGATVMMVPSSFCGTNYDFSALCGSFNPIYVLYFGMGNWTTGGNLANQQSPSPKPKYLTLNMSSVNAGCGMQYYTYDANSEAAGNGAGVAFSGTISTNSASPTAPAAYTSATCTVPIVLPISLAEFEATLVSVSSARVSFTTLEENNVKQFNLYKSYDGVNYKWIASEKAANTRQRADYTIFDLVEYTEKPLLYYRLDEEDLNGAKKTAGNCVLLLRAGGDVSINISGNELWINSPTELAEVKIVSAEGKPVALWRGGTGQAGAIINLSGLPTGFYPVIITDTSGKVTVKKLIR